MNVYWKNKEWMNAFGISRFPLTFSSLAAWNLLSGQVTPSSGSRFWLFITRAWLSKFKWVLLLSEPQFPIPVKRRGGLDALHGNQLVYWLKCAFLEHVLEKAMAPHSSTLAWKIPWMEEPGRLQSMGSLRVGHDWVTSLSLFTLMHWRRIWQPTPVFLPGESQGRGILVGCRLWDRTELDTTEVTQQSMSSSRRLEAQGWGRDCSAFSSADLHDVRGQL